jgi:signal transduction histidine kinase
MVLPDGHGRRITAADGEGYNIHVPLRSKLIIYGVVMLLLITGLSAGSFLALSAASREAENAREELEKLTLVESLREHCVFLGPVPDPLACQQAREAVTNLTARPWSDRQRKHLERIVALTEGLEHGQPKVDVPALRKAVADFERSVLKQVEKDLRLAEKPTHRRAVRLLVAAALVALGGSATFAWLYARLVRERKELESRVHRSEKLAALGTLAAGVAHEINNPLATIAISSEVLSERLDPASEEAEFCRAIQEEAERCRSITSDLSDLARGGTLDREPVDVRDLFTDAVRIVRRGRAPNGAEIRAVAARDLPLISADRGKLLQVLVNLLENGAEAVGEKGSIVLSARRMNENLRIQVRDDGRGIPPNRLERIFEPFYTDKDHGVGIGLTVCHRIAELHGGVLTAVSGGDGRGSTFTLDLPLDGESHDGN